ncbi:MAG: hypothetical protein NC395_04385 [Prevotella sp.]|nr:hypothetical protein [Prevotella sp.]
MKKYLFFTVSAAAAVFLSACQRDRTATVVYTDVPSPLTQMTFSESLPPETYSEYMATYTSETETSRGGHYFSMLIGSGIYADTGVTAPPGIGGGLETLKKDTAVATAPPVSEPDGEETVTCAPTGTDVPTDTDTDITETEVTEETTTVTTLVRPKADTGISAFVTKVTGISADTSQTSLSSESETTDTSDAE